MMGLIRDFGPYQSQDTCFRIRKDQKRINLEIFRGIQFLYGDYDLKQQMWMDIYILWSLTEV